MQRSLRDLAEWKIRYARERLLGEAAKGKRRRDIGERVNEDLRSNPPSSQEWETAIAHRAAEAYHQGYILLAIAPGLKKATFESVVKRRYREEMRRLQGVLSKSRSRWNEWLPLIKEFEEAETDRGTGPANAQHFARFRRAVDGIEFA